MAAVEGEREEAEVVIPAAARKVVQMLRGIVGGDRADKEIYAALLDCAMDPDLAAEQLLSQGTFHEVKRKRDKKKEIKGTQEPRPRTANDFTNRGTRGGSYRNGRFAQKSLGETATRVKNTGKKENGTISSSNLGYGKKAKGSTENLGVPSVSAPEKTVVTSNDEADGQAIPLQPASSMQHGWSGKPGGPSMADIVKRGRPQANASNRPVNATDPSTYGNSVVAKLSDHSTKESTSTALPSKMEQEGLLASDSLVTEVQNVSNKNEVDAVNAISPELPDGGNGSALLNIEPSEVQNVSNENGVDAVNAMSPELPDGGKGSTLLNAEPSGSSKLLIDERVTTDPHLDAAQETKGHVHAIDLTSGQPASVSDREIQSKMFEDTTDIEAVHADKELSSAVTNFEQLSLQKEEQARTKSAEDIPAVIIPNHLRVTSADCAYLTFGSFEYRALAGNALNNSLEVPSLTDNSPSVDQADARNHEYSNNGPLAHPSSEYSISTAINSMENLDMPSVSQPEVGRNDVLDAVHGVQYNLPAVSSYSTSSVAQPDSAAHTYLQANGQVQNVSPFSIMQQTMPYVRDFDQSLAHLLAAQSMTMKYSAASSSIGGATVPAQENAKPGDFSNAQSAQSLPSTSIPSGPLPQHLALNHYSQSAVPVGPFTSLIYPPSYYIPPYHQQQYVSTGVFNQAAAAGPGNGLKYPLPHFKSNVALTGLQHMLYLGNNMPGSFPLNPSVSSTATTLGFDAAALGTLYKDGNLSSLQQSDNPAIWMQGAGSRAMPPLAATYYGYQTQSQQTGVRQGQQPSQYNALGHLGVHHSQIQEHLNPTDGSVPQSTPSLASNQLWPNSY